MRCPSPGALRSRHLPIAIILLIRAIRGGFSRLVLRIVVISIKSWVQAGLSTLHKLNKVTLNTVLLMVLVLAYAAPYLAGFAYERRVIPINAPYYIFGLVQGRSHSQLEAGSYSIISGTSHPRAAPRAAFQCDI